MKVKMGGIDGQAADRLTQRGWRNSVVGGRVEQLESELPESSPLESRNTPVSVPCWRSRDAVCRGSGILGRGGRFAEGSLPGSAEAVRADGADEALIRMSDCAADTILLDRADEPAKHE